MPHDKPVDHETGSGIPSRSLVPPSVSAVDHRMIFTARSSRTIHGVRAGWLSCLVDSAYRTLLPSIPHLPPSAVSFVGDVRFRRSAQRLARLT